LLLILIGAISQSAFLNERSLRNILVSSTPLSIATVGQTLTMLTAGIDLSIGSVVSLTTVVAAFLMRQYPNDVVAIVLLCMVTGVAVGTLNGLAVGYLRLNPFILTLAAGIVVQGLALEIMYQPGGLVTRGFQIVARGTIGPVPYSFFYLLFLYLMGTYVLKRTTYGLSIYAVGGNELSAHLSGIRSKRVTASVYIISGFLASCGGLFIASRIGSGDPLVGEPYSLDSITAAILGGVSLFGAVGDLWGGLAGAMIIGILSTMLNLNNISSFYQWIFKGVILIAALALDLRHKRGHV
jgi:ribose transport system permease protein